MLEILLFILCLPIIISIGYFAFGMFIALLLWGAERSSKNETERWNILNISVYRSFFTCFIRFIRIN